MQVWRWDPFLFKWGQLKSLSYHIILGAAVCHEDTRYRAIYQSAEGFANLLLAVPPWTSAVSRVAKMAFARRPRAIFMPCPPGSPGPHGHDESLPLPTLLQAPLRSRPCIKETSAGAGDTSPMLKFTGYHCLLTQVTFMWSNQVCYGSQFHLEVLNGDEQEVFRQLSQGADVFEAFHYKSQIQSQGITEGQPIHLAASRGHIAVVDVLLRFGASLETWVMRDDQKIYDVLHAAVHREGFGGSEEMIDFLGEKKADIMSANSVNDNHWTPLHVAFQTGNEATIQAVAKHVNQWKQSLQEQCPWNLDDEQDIDFQDDQRKPTPLEVGIKRLGFYMILYTPEMCIYIYR